MSRTLRGVDAGRLLVDRLPGCLGPCFLYPACPVCTRPTPAHVPSQPHVGSRASRSGWAVGTPGDHVPRCPNWLAFLLPLECRYMVMNVHGDRPVLGGTEGSKSGRESRTGEWAADPHVALGCHTHPHADGAQGTLGFVNCWAVTSPPGICVWPVD